MYHIFYALSTLFATITKYYDWNCKHEENEELDTLYDFLVRIGYQMSDEESALRDGTHELFEGNEVDDDE